MSGAKIRITFTDEDFNYLLVKNGVDPASMTEDEWRTFEKMFMEGIHWDEIADHAAWIIADKREEDDDAD